MPYQVKKQRMTSCIFSPILLWNKESFKVVPSWEIATMVQNNDTCTRYPCSYNQEQGTFDWILFQVLAVGIFVTILVSNSVVIWRIHSSNRHTRANAMFILLSVADIMVALISVTLFYATLFKLDNTLPFFQNCHSIIFSMLVPVYCSWYLTVTITLDRFFLVKYPIRYRNFMTRKILLRILPVWLLIYIAIMLLIYYEKDMMGGISIVGGIVQLTSTLILFAAYGYIFMVIRRRKINSNDLVRNPSNRRLTMTIFYIFLSQFVCAIPATITKFLYVKSWGDPNMEEDMGYWSNLFLFSNSFTNALILLQSQNYLKKKDEDKKSNDVNKLKLAMVVANPNIYRFTEKNWKWITSHKSFQNSRSLRLSQIYGRITCTPKILFLLPSWHLPAQSYQ